MDVTSVVVQRSISREKFYVRATQSLDRLGQYFAYSGGWTGNQFKAQVFEFPTDKTGDWVDCAKAAVPKGMTVVGKAEWGDKKYKKLSP